MSRRIVIRMAVFIAFLLLVLALPIGARGDMDENRTIDGIDREMILQ